MAKSTKNASEPSTDELGVVAPGITTPGWEYFHADFEYVNELRWPLGMRWFQMMSMDPLIAGIIDAIEGPILEGDVYIDPNGADDDIVQALAEDIGIPIHGVDAEPRSRQSGRFSFYEYMETALDQTLLYGFMPAEKVWTKEDSARAWFRLSKVAPRPWYSLERAPLMNPDGSLKGILQRVNNEAVLIPADKLVMTLWKKVPGSWVGRSFLRPMYKPWLVKDDTTRTTATNIQKAGGIPYAIGPQKAPKGILRKINDILSKLRMGKTSAATFPFGTQIEAFKGDTGGGVEFINLQNEEIARYAGAMFMMLGQTKTGSRSLGDTFIDAFRSNVRRIAKSILDPFNEQVVEDYVNVNKGPDAAAPIVRIKIGNIFDSLDALLRIIESGGIQVDEGIETEIRNALDLPDKAVDGAHTPADQSLQYDLAEGVVTIGERRRQLDLPAGKYDALTVPELLAKFGVKAAASPEGAAGAQPAVSGSPSVAAAAEPERVMRPFRPTILAAGELRLPDRQLRRQPTDNEIRASIDFGAMDQQWMQSRTALVAAWQPVQQQQVTDLRAQVASADGDLTRLATLTPKVLGAAILQEALMQMVGDGADGALAEAKAQGLPAPPVLHPASDPAVQADIADRAVAIATELAQSLATAATDRALELTAGSGSQLSPLDVSDDVGATLSATGDSWLEGQFGGALTAAQNTGRAAIMDRAPEGTTFHATEILDGNTCEPCREVDNKQYATLAAAARDYPTGGFKGCLGRKRCRGAVFAVYPSETPAEAHGDEHNVAAADWDPAKHPRGKGGEFGVGRELHKLADDHPAFAHAADETRANGGGTFEPATMQPFHGADGTYQVALQREEVERVVPNDDTLPASIAKYRQDHAQLLAKPGYHVGTYVAKDGSVALDVSTVVGDRSEAIKLGKARGQESILDWAALKRGDMDKAFIDTGGTVGDG